MASKPSTDVAAIPTDPFTQKPDLSQMDYSQLMALFDAGAVVHIHELDDTEQAEKADLVGVPMVITYWERKVSEIGEYVVVRATTPTGKVVFADGSTGIKDQLVTFAVDQPIFIPKGLRRSDYTYKDEKGSTIPATTFYLDNSTN